ncbi:MAG: FlgD immunoglobulin-like domain containing protein, partial [Calditrichia bacterium]
PFNPDPDGEVTSPVVAPRYWELITSIGGTSYYAKVAFSYAGVSGVQDPQQLRIAYRDVSAGAGDVWSFIPKSATQVVEVDKEIIITGQSGAQTFTQGQFTIVSDYNDNSLPVSISTFRAKVIQDNNIKIIWVTESEINNNGFYVERKSANENEYSTLSFIQGAGNSNIHHNYSYIDSNLNNGEWFYRLKQVDFNGDFTYFGPISVHIEQTTGIDPIDFTLFQNYPNPFNPSTQISFRLPNDYKGDAFLKIYNTLGQEVITLMEGHLPPGIHKVNWDGKDANGQTVRSGVYYYFIKGESFYQSKKMIFIK